MFGLLSSCREVWLGGFVCARCESAEQGAGRALRSGLHCQHQRARRRRPGTGVTCVFRTANDVKRKVESKAELRFSLLLLRACSCSGHFLFLLFLLRPSSQICLKHTENQNICGGSLEQKKKKKKSNDCHCEWWMLYCQYSQKPRLRRESSLKAVRDICDCCSMLILISIFILIS